MKYSNIIVPFDSDNTTAIDFIVTNLRSKLQEHQSRGNISKKLRNPAMSPEERINVSEEEQMVPVPKSLNFEIVDYAIDFIGFKRNVT